MCTVALWIFCSYPNYWLPKLYLSVYLYVTMYWEFRLNIIISTGNLNVKFVFDWFCLFPLCLLGLTTQNHQPKPLDQKTETTWKIVIDMIWQKIIEIAWQNIILLIYKFVFRVSKRGNSDGLSTKADFSHVAFRNLAFSVSGLDGLSQCSSSKLRM